MTYKYLHLHMHVILNDEGEPQFSDLQDSMPFVGCSECACYGCMNERMMSKLIFQEVLTQTAWAEPDWTQPTDDTWWWEYDEQGAMRWTQGSVWNICWKHTFCITRWFDPF